MREERLKRMQVFQAETLLREEPEEEEYKEDEAVEEHDPSAFKNTLYSSYKEAVENKVEL